jgi:hypothetical protein
MEQNDPLEQETVLTWFQKCFPRLIRRRPKPGLKTRICFGAMLLMALIVTMVLVSQPRPYDPIRRVWAVKKAQALSNTATLSHGVNFWQSELDQTAYQTPAMRTAISTMRVYLTPRYVRVFLGWNQSWTPGANPSPTYNWTYADNTMMANGLTGALAGTYEPYVVGVGAPKWALVDPDGPPCGPIKPEYNDDYAAWMKALLLRYPKVNYVALQNEVDVDYYYYPARTSTVPVHTPPYPTSTSYFYVGCWGEIYPGTGGANYGRFVLTVVPVLKTARPQVQVVIGELMGVYDDWNATTTVTPPRKVRFMDEALDYMDIYSDGNVCGNFDVIGLHFYGQNYYFKATPTPPLPTIPPLTQTPQLVKMSNYEWSLIQKYECDPDHQRNARIFVDEINMAHAGADAVECWCEADSPEIECPNPDGVGLKCPAGCTKHCDYSGTCCPGNPTTHTSCEALQWRQAQFWYWLDTWARSNHISAVFPFLVWEGGWNENDMIDFENPQCTPSTYNMATPQYLAPTKPAYRAFCCAAHSKYDYLSCKALSGNPCNVP